ncbi:MAG TPA: DUF58 domain-containing protein, partial [Anaerolineales bacterium]
MAGAYVPLLILLVALAAFLRDDFALTLIYLFVAAFAAGTWWSRRALSRLEQERHFSDHAFLGEQIAIEIQVRNRGWLPVPWLELRETLPLALAGPQVFRRVTSLGPRGASRFEYSMQALKRGYYPIGPMFISSGDILGLNEPARREWPVEYLTVYPKIIPLTKVKIPSQSPQGTLRHTQPLFEDPTRVFGKREYTAGDSLRRVDWKSTAATGQLQVKIFEPSIALETLICLNLNAGDYHHHTRIDSTELAIVIAASLGNWITSKGQTVGLKVNGRDPLIPEGIPQYFPPRKGKMHLMRMLETLARVDLTSDSSFTALIQEQHYHLSWGTTLLVITGEARDDLLDELYQARRSGQNAVLILAGRSASSEESRVKARFFGIPVVSILHER